jgi:hypothetical protein
MIKQDREARAKKMIKCNRCGEEAHHVHHKDGNNKNNKKGNLESLCTLCHAKEHGIEPRISELKKLVLYFNKVQKMRMSIYQTIESYRNIELQVPDGARNVLEILVGMEKKAEKEIVKHFKNNPTPLYKWLVSIYGIADILAGKMLSEIDFDKTPSEASLWRYAGLAPDSKKKKGQKANYNPRLRAYCSQLADSFIKKRTPKYREVYDKEKEKQIKNGLTKGHAEGRARRKIAKVFLRDLHSRAGEATTDRVSLRPVLSSPLPPLKKTSFLGETQMTNLSRKGGEGR